MLRLSFYAVAAITIAAVTFFGAYRYAHTSASVTPQDADVNKDGAVTIADAISVLPHIGQLAPAIAQAHQTELALSLDLIEYPGDWGFTSQRGFNLDPTNYPTNSVFTLGWAVYSEQVGNYHCDRLVNLDDPNNPVPITGAEVCSTYGTSHHYFESPAFTFPPGPHYYGWESKVFVNGSGAGYGPVEGSLSVVVRWAN